MTYENKLGLFIHFGPYALYGVHEQILARFDLEHAEYEARAMAFCPTDCDPEEWVLLAKETGMKYICFTAKHHDGFCMWDTKYTDYSIMHTPYGKDVLKMLAKACEKHGMLLSIYYSCPDWHHPAGYNSASTHQWKAKNQDGCVDHEEYLEYVKGQITELLTSYGKIYTFFWDIPPRIERPEMNELIRRLQPGIYINNRGYSEGDFSTPERDETPIGYSRFLKMAEACNSVDLSSWGYNACPKFHSLRYLTGAIDKVMALGGSYLLNVGPDENGRITENYARRIKAVGAWFKKVSVSLESSDDAPFDYGVCTDKCIVNTKAGKTYFHFPEGLSTDTVIMKKYKKIPQKAKLLNTGEVLQARIERLPSSIGKIDKVLASEYLTLGKIPVDELFEAIVIEVEW